MCSPEAFGVHELQVCRMCSLTIECVLLERQRRLACTNCRLSTESAERKMTQPAVETKKTARAHLSHFRSWFRV